MRKTVITTDFLIIIELRHPLNSEETVFILGDSMVKKINGFYLIKKIKHKFLVKVRRFSSAKTRCLNDHAKPTIRELNPTYLFFTLYQ